jgi:RHS repeat-associated protein
MGNLTQRQDNNLGLTEGVWYDNDYRLSYTKLNGTQNLTMGYDLTGNITSKSDVAGGATWTYDPSRKHQVTQAGSSAYNYTYDANGNVGERQGQYITWASYNYPIYVYAGSGSTAERVDFNYGPDRKRWSQTYYNLSAGSWETTEYIGGLYELVFGSAPGTTYRHYIYAGTEPVAVYARTTGGTNTFNYMLSDHQGSVSDLTSSTGTSTVNESFTPFGNRRNPTTWSGAASNADLTTAANITRQGYTFQTQLGLWMGLNHMNGRVQDSITGRFLSADPTVPYPGQAQSYNRYSYARNNPLSFVDPSGFEDDVMDDDDDGGGGDGGGGATYTGSMIPGHVPNGLTVIPGDSSGSNTGSNAAPGGQSGGVSSSGTADTSTNATAAGSSSASSGAAVAGSDSTSSASTGGDATQSASEGNNPVGSPASSGSVAPNNQGVEIVWYGTPNITDQSTGSYTAYAGYTVPAGANGVIVQQVTFEGAPPYYELWDVSNGVVLNPSGGSGINDHFGSPVATTETGVVQFYPGGTAADFPNLVPGQVSSAGGLPSSWIQPSNWQSSGGLPHQVSVTGSPGAYTISTIPCSAYRCGP